LELGLAIGREPHYIAILGPDELPKCLLRHISTANHMLNEPFSRSKLREYARNIARFLHDMTENMGWLDYSCCDTLIDFMEFVPEPRHILEYERLMN